MTAPFFQGNPEKHTAADVARFSAYARYFESSPLPVELKLANFSKYVRRQDLCRFLARAELFKLCLDLPGVIIECGSYAGGGLMTYAQLSSIYEPYNHQRRIYAFDSFCGFPGVSNKDQVGGSVPGVGDLHVHENIREEILEGIKLQDENRALGHIPKTELVVGDALNTIPEFMADNPHIVVAMLYLDFDLYEPTKLAIETFYERMPKGAILAFDEVCADKFPGETLALLESVGIRHVALRKTSFDPYISYAILE